MDRRKSEPRIGLTPQRSSHLQASSEKDPFGMKINKNIRVSELVSHLSEKPPQSYSQISATSKLLLNEDSQLEMNDMPRQKEDFDRQKAETSKFGNDDTYSPVKSKMSNHHIFET